MKWLRVLIVFAPVACMRAGTLPSPAPQEVVDTYTAISREQGERLRGASMEVEIEANLPKLQKQGRLHALRRISRLGRITYEALRFEGDKTVKNNIIARYLTADTEAQSADQSLLAVIPANYKFKFKGHSGEGENQIYIFQLTPRKKRVGLFKGKIFLQEATGRLVRAQGTVTKTPSFFISKIRFTQDYGMVAGFTLPTHIRSEADTRLVGKALVDMVHRDYQPEISGGDDSRLVSLPSADGAN